MKAAGFLFIGLFSCAFLQADVVLCDNGDRYNGKVLSLDDKQIKIQNDITGVLVIPRDKVVSISFRPVPPAGRPKSVTVPEQDLSQLAPGKRIQVDPEAVERVENDILSGATPEARQMYQEMVRGLMSGQLDVGQIRSQAQSALRELRSLQTDLGDEDATALLDTYSAILENFLRQTDTNRSSSRAVRPAPSAK